MLKAILEELTEINEADTIGSNDVKKGWEIQTKSGCMAVMLNNKKGNIREIKTTTENGCYAEIGTVYAWDIVKVRETPKDKWMTIKLNPKQEKAKISAQKMGF